jgi:hypothetical protein
MRQKHTYEGDIVLVGGRLDRYGTVRADLRTVFQQPGHKLRVPTIHRVMQGGCRAAHRWQGR